MLKNYITIAIRNFIKDRFYSSINVSGLALGIASSLLIVMYVLHELSYDRSHPQVDTKYRVNQTDIWSPDGGVMGSTVLPLAQVLVDEYPEVISALRINTMGTHTVRSVNGEKVFNEPDVLAADSNFFSFFNFPLIEGDPHTALQGINKVVISEEAASKYFGSASPLGKTLYFGKDKIPLEVTGVVAQPVNTHFNFNFLLSIYTNPFVREYEWNWIATQVVTYVELVDGTHERLLEDKFRNIADHHIKPVMRRFNIDFDEFIEGKGEWSFYLQPVRDINLYSGSIGNRLGKVSDILYIYIFASAAVLIIILAAINFMNLATARAGARAREIGVRKSVGSSRKQLIVQLLVESVMVCGVATILGLGLMELGRMLLSHILGLNFSISIWSEPLLLTGILLLPLVLGVLSGIYPAFYLTSIKPAHVLKGTAMVKGKRSAFRNVLVIAQFTVSIALAICTMVVFQQLEYFNHKNLGFEKDNILVINNAEKLGDHLESYRNEIASHPGVSNASIAMDMPGRGSYEDIFTKEADNTRLAIAQLKIDEHFFNTMGFELLTGRAFSGDRPSDANAVIINETTMKHYGWTPSSALGEKIQYLGDDVGQLEVIGVVKDFNFQSLQYTIHPFMFFHTTSSMWGSSRVLALKVESGTAASVIGMAREKWSQYASEDPFEYSFLDQEYAMQYESESRLAKLFSVFAGFALIIACMGLFGLAAYTVHQRSKEIGVRKVLGASVSQLIMMLNGNFTKLVVIACALALPIAWYGAVHWLDQFAYKVDLNWIVFLIPAALALLISWLTVSYQSYRAAGANPTDVLKNE